jgi:tRNA pseudouridine-54 N-methylase
LTVAQAVKKYKLEPLNLYTAKAKAKDFNVEEVLYGFQNNNKYVYIVKDGENGYLLYKDERNFYTKLYKGLKITPLDE